MPDITSEQDAGTAVQTSGGTVIEVPAPLPDRPPERDRMADNLVPIALFLAIALTYCIKYYFAWRTRHEAQATVRAAIERGEPLTPELLDRLMQPQAPKRNDLRRGVVGICLGVAVGAVGLVLGNPEALRPLLAIGLIPMLIGLAYLVLWRLVGDRARD